MHIAQVTFLDILDTYQTIFFRLYHDEVNHPCDNFLEWSQ